MAAMGRLEFGKLRDAWKGEAADFTPLLAEQLDALGDAIGISLASIGAAEVPLPGGRRIDILAQDADGVEFIVENQFGRADHDHLTRGLAYAVARRARGLIVVAEEHRDEFRAVASYLNDLADLDRSRGVAVWLVEARAVRIDASHWAPLFVPVVEPNAFITAAATADEATQRLSSLDDFWQQFEDSDAQEAAKAVLATWTEWGHRWRLGPNHVVLMARGRSKSRLRTVVVVYSDGRILVPFGSYAGQNSGIPIEALTTDDFRQGADTMFGFKGTERQARTGPGWLNQTRADALLSFCRRVAEAYSEDLAGLPAE